MSVQFFLGVLTGIVVTSDAVLLTMHLVSQPIDRIGEDET